MRGRPRTSCEVVDFDGREWLYLRSIPVDVAIIRATTADEYGNLTCEDEGAPLGVLDQALAAHNNGGVVIAQVKRLAKGRTLPAQAVRVPGIVVDAIVVAPDQLQTTQTVLLPEAAGHYRAPISELELAPWGPEKVVARRASQELRDGEAVNLGFGISALVPRILLEEGLDGSVTWVIEQGAVGGVPFLGFQFGCAQNPDALLASPDQFTYLQGGGFDRALLSFLEVDADGNVNVSRLNAKPHVTAGRRRLRRHHGPRQADRLLGLLHRRRTARDRGRPHPDRPVKASTSASCRRSSTSPSAAGGPASSARRSCSSPSDA